MILKKAALASVVFSVAAMGSLLRAENQAASRPSRVSTEKGTLTATVTAINPKTREITLKGPDGNSMTVEAGDDVKNFDQIKKGDQVVADYLISTAIFVRDPGEKEAPQKTSTVTMETAALGESPAATLAGTVEITATVKSIDYKNRTVVLQGPEGNTRTVKVPAEVKRFNEVKKGDIVVAQITKTVAISVRKPS